MGTCLAPAMMAKINSTKHPVSFERPPMGIFTMLSMPQRRCLQLKAVSKMQVKHYHSSQSEGADHILGTRRHDRSLAKLPDQSIHHRLLPLPCPSECKGPLKAPFIGSLEAALQREESAGAANHHNVFLGIDHRKLAQAAGWQLGHQAQCVGFTTNSCNSA